MPRLPLIALALPLCLPAIARADIDDEPRLVNPDVPWVLHAGPPVPDTLVEQYYGVEIPEDAWPEPIRNGDMVFDRESFASEYLEGLGLPEPLPGMAQPETPGILVVEMGGATMSGYCGNGEGANGALNCSPLIDGTNVNYPASNANQGAVLQEVRGYMADFGLIIAGQRPPPFVPYTLAMVGGSSTQFGYEGGVCGIANVACDGLKRNHVSLTFENCGLNGVADVVAQETSHNWGLEHTNNTADLLYPTANGGSKSYVDQCMGIVDNGGTIQCSYVHEFYCPNGGGMQQNSHAEMLGVFGPFFTDDQAPQITNIQPADGSTFDSSESVIITASISENSRFAGVRWTWENADPMFANEDGTFTKCTNKVCDLDFAAFRDPSEDPWDFITLQDAPAGDYIFTFEAMDAYGNAVSETITVTITGGASTGGTATATATGGSDTTTAGTDSGGTASGGTDATSAGTFTTGDTAGMDDGKDGCACTTNSESPGWALAPLVLLGLVRRRN